MRRLEIVELGKFTSPNYVNFLSHGLNFRFHFKHYVAPHWGKNCALLSYFFSLLIIRIQHGDWPGGLRREKPAFSACKLVHGSAVLIDLSDVDVYSWVSNIVCITTVVFSWKLRQNCRGLCVVIVREDSWHSCKIEAVQANKIHSGSW